MSKRAWVWRLRTAGRTYRQIAAEVGLCTGTVCHYLSTGRDEPDPSRFQVGSRPPPRQESRDADISRRLDWGMSYGEVAAVLGITRNVVAGVAHRTKARA